MTNKCKFSESVQFINSQPPVIALTKELFFNMLQMIQGFPARIVAKMHHNLAFSSFQLIYLINIRNKEIRWCGNAPFPALTIFFSYALARFGEEKCPPG